MKLAIALLFCTSILFVKCQDTTSHLAPPKQKSWFDFNDKFYNYRLYFYWGYNRDYFSHSDIHFHGPGYDFTVYDVTARDRPEKFSFKTKAPFYLALV